MDDKSMSKPGVKDHIGIRTGHTTSIIASVKEYLTQHPADYLEQVDSLLEGDEEFCFYSGGMGEFDAMSARAVRVLKQHHPEKQIHLYLVLPYMKQSVNEDKLLKTLYDEIIIPMELAECHYKSAIDA